MARKSPHQRILTGAELRQAAKLGIPVIYTETYHNPQDHYMNFHGECVLKKASSGFYIGNSDIDPNEFKDEQLVQGEFPEGTFQVCAAEGQSYQPQ